VSEDNESVVVAEFTIESKKLQHTFSRHAHAFGIIGDWNNNTAAQLERAIRDHVDSHNVEILAGTYRRAIQVTHFFNPETHLWVAVDTRYHFVAAWQLSPTQVESLYSSGNVQ
jgi:hypothetical protein